MAEHKPTVERDANGVPTAWLLVRAGPVPLRKNGADYVLELTSKDLSAIEAYQKSQGERIPIDSNHYLHILAQKHGIKEREALQIMPSGVAAMGFGTLECLFCMSYPVVHGCSFSFARSRLSVSAFFPQESIQVLTKRFTACILRKNIPKQGQPVNDSMRGIQ